MKRQNTHRGTYRDEAMPGNPYFKKNGRIAQIMVN